MKTFRIVLWIVLFVLVLGSILSVAVISNLSSQSFSTVGNLESQAVCENSLRNTWCSSGYSCTSCSQITLAYNLRFSDGVSTNHVWSADCVYGVTPQDSAHSFCQATNNIVSHTKSHCYSGNVYWYNSIGAREDLRNSCSNGCSATTLDAASCNVAPVASSGNFCLFNSDGSPNNYLCNGINQGVNVQTGTPNILCNMDSKVYCSFGCSNGVCNPQSCSNDCDSNNYKVCSGDSTFKVCSVGSDKCLHWSNDYGCLQGQVCNNGQCVLDNSVPIVSSPSCTADKCVSDYTYQTCDNGVVSPTKVCDDGYKCNSGSCIKVSQQNITQSGNVDLCANIICSDRCDGTTLDSQGNCVNGQCVYNDVVLSSVSCLSNSTINNPLTQNTKSPSALSYFFDFNNGAGYYSITIIAIIILISGILLLTRKK